MSPPAPPPPKTRTLQALRVLPVWLLFVKRSVNFHFGGFFRAKSFGVLAGFSWGYILGAFFLFFEVFFAPKIGFTPALPTTSGVGGGHGIKAVIYLLGDFFPLKTKLLFALFGLKFAK